jgi:hypothetical protein
MADALSPQRKRRAARGGDHRASRVDAGEGGRRTPGGKAAVPRAVRLLAGGSLRK